MVRLLTLLRSPWFFYLVLLQFIAGSLYIAALSIYPMAFDEEFHLGLMQIYATSLLPFGIEHTSDMAQFGSATADASYLFHYLMSFPYRILSAFGLSTDAIVISLRIINIGFVVAALFVFRKVFSAANVSPALGNVALLLLTLVPIFPLLAAHINYDNLLLLVFAWALLAIIRMTNTILKGAPFRLSDILQLGSAVLIGMSIKYAFLPLALGLFIWLCYLLVASAHQHNISFSSQLTALKNDWGRMTKKSRFWGMSLVLLSLFFASHYVTNLASYGSPIPSCERVFSETECTAYGPWNRNKNMEARKPESFEPMSYPVYMAKEWLPGMAQRLTFAVAGKTNNFDTKLPMPALVSLFVTLTVLGIIAISYQAVRRRLPWFGWLSLLLTVIYCGVLSFQLYGDYVDTAQPVAINGRYLLPLLPLITVSALLALRPSLSFVSSSVLSVAVVFVTVLAIVSGGGAGTYIALADADWFWSGWPQMTQQSLQQIVTTFILPYRY